MSGDCVEGRSIGKTRGINIPKVMREESREFLLFYTLTEIQCMDMFFFSLRNFSVENSGANSLIVGWKLRLSQKAHGHQNGKSTLSSILTLVFCLGKSGKNSSQLNWLYEGKGSHWGRRGRTLVWPWTALVTAFFLLWLWPWVSLILSWGLSFLIFKMKMRTVHPPWSSG